MFDFKNIFASKTVLATLVGVIFSLLNALGVVNLDAEVQAAVVTVLFALAGIFRINATQQLSLHPAEAQRKAAARRHY